MLEMALTGYSQEVVKAAMLGRDPSQELLVLRELRRLQEHFQSLARAPAALRVRATRLRARHVTVCGLAVAHWQECR